jgi:hypothetical protein
MDFSCAQFEGFTMHIALYPMAGPESSTEDISRKRGKLFELLQTYSEHLTFINTRYVIIASKLLNLGCLVDAYKYRSLPFLLNKS